MENQASAFGCLLGLPSSCRSGRRTPGRLSLLVIWARDATVGDGLLRSTLPTCSTRDRSPGSQHPAPQKDDCSSSLIPIRSLNGKELLSDDFSRDEPTLAVENAGNRWAFGVIQLGVVSAVIYRGPAKLACATRTVIK